MNRDPLPPMSALHVHVRRLVVDAGALGPGGAARNLDALLQAALSSRLGGEAVANANAPQWVESVADALAARARDAVPTPESGR